MTQILPGAFEELGRVLQGRATGKTKGDMVFSDHDIAKRSIPFERQATSGSLVISHQNL